MRKYNKKQISDSERRRRIEYEKRERYCLTQIFNALKEKNPHLKYSMYMSPIDIETAYDAILTIKNEKDEVIKTFILEAKNRTSIYSKMYYEKKKHNGLVKTKANIKLELDRDAEILYINFTKQCTFIFAIDEMELGKSTRELMTDESFADEIGQRNKLVYSLPLKEAFKMKFKYDEQEYLKSIEPVKIAPITETKQIKTYSLF